MKIKFILDYPAAFLPKEKILIISDLHIGLEHELHKKGIKIPSQAEKFKKIIDHLIDLKKAKTLIILGDIKHEVPGISYREMREIPKLFERLMEKVTIHVIKGNHDGNISTLLPEKIKIHPPNGFKIARYGFFHGHAWPSKELMECDYLFMGHVHPIIELKDKLGYRFSEQVWVKAKLDSEKIEKKYKIKKHGKLNLFIFPAFNKLLGGLVLNKPEQEEFLGPLLRKNILEIKKAEIYLLDGTFLGSLEDILNK